MGYCYYRDADSHSGLKNKNFVLVVGRICSGKSVACRLAESEFGYKHVTCSQIMLNVSEYDQKYKSERKVLQDIGYSLISDNRGHDKFALGIREFMQKFPGDKYTFDGLRSPNTVTKLESLIKQKIFTIHIKNTTNELFTRYKNKYKLDISYKDFIEILNHPVEKEIERFDLQTDLFVNNFGTLDDYLNVIRRLFNYELQR